MYIVMWLTCQGIFEYSFDMATSWDMSMNIQSMPIESVKKYSTKYSYLFMLMLPYSPNNIHDWWALHQQKVSKGLVSRTQKLSTFYVELVLDMLLHKQFLMDVTLSQLQLKFVYIFDQFHQKYIRHNVTTQYKYLLYKNLILTRNMQSIKFTNNQMSA